ncbi:MAG: PfkB family carbohydrate kinase [Pseudomonadota bacterium]
MIKKIIAYSEPLEEINAKGEVGVSGDCVGVLVGGKRMEPIIANVLDDHTPVTFSLFSAIGNDARGQKINTFLQNNGIDISLLSVIEGTNTAAFSIDIEMQSGKHTMRYHDRDHSAVRQLFNSAHQQKINDLINALDQNSFFILSGIGASRPMTDEAYHNFFDMVKRAKEKGACIILDPNFRWKLWKKNPHDTLEAAQQYGQEVMNKLVKFSTMVFITYPDDLAYFAEVAATPETLGKQLLEHGPRYVVVKNGDKGALLFSKEHHEHPLTISPYPANAVDTSGAGDAFLAGAVTALAHGADIVAALKIAARTGAQMVQQHGALLSTQSVPDETLLRTDLA